MEAYQNSLNFVNNDKFNQNRKLSELTPHYRYSVELIKSVKTKFNTNTKVVTLRDESNNLIDVFLPHRYNDVNFNLSYNHVLYYRGKKDMYDHRQYHHIEFEVTGLKKVQTSKVPPWMNQNN